MNLPNIHFQDFPIDFKQINPEDFPNFEVEEKVKLEIKDGFIGNSFIHNLDFEASDTTVLNCGVGSGKTTAIIKAIQQFYENEEYVIFVASPYLSLVKQYFNDIQDKADVPENSIFRHEWIGETTMSYTDKRIHIVTINALLGNPGENAFINSASKRRYLNEMVSYCEDNNKKVVFIFDEIHDSIHNFKEKYIFNLWKWRNVIHKNFVISATFSEASKVVIEYLAELTHNKIKIFEADRIKSEENLSDLYLYFDNSNTYTNENGNLVSIVESIFEKGMDLDILCFSKKLCKSILESKEDGVGKLIFEKYGENINDCTSGLSDDNVREDRNYDRNRYSNEKCNVGTNFKSGVSIEKENHAFILIFPPISARKDFKGNYGIFNGGINNIIQAIARKRRKGEIHILLPKPTKFDFNSFPFDENHKERVKHFLESIQFQSTRPSANRIRDTKLIEYIPFDKQDELLSEFYHNELLHNVKDGVEHISGLEEDGRRTHKVRLKFPEYKLFKLEDGEDYLAQKFKFLGNDLSGYMSYSAATNQFVNCNWVYSNATPVQNFKEGNLQYCFDKFFENYFDEDWFFSLKQKVSDKYLYFEIRNEIFSQYKIKYYKQDDSCGFIQPFENKEFESQLLAFIQRKLYRNNIEFTRRCESSRGWIKDDTPYTRGDYFSSCIAHARNLRDNESLTDDTKALVNAYIQLDYFRSKIQESFLEGTKSGETFNYLNNQPFSGFVTDEECTIFEDMCSVICEKDILIENGVFDFRRSIARTHDLNKKIYSFYNYLIEDFFETFAETIYEDGKQQRVKRLNNVKEIPEPNKVLNLLLGSEYNFPESFWNPDNYSDFEKSLTRQE